MIVVLGSLNVDLVARVDRLPAAGETLRAQDFSMVPGGKGANQALAARRAGADVRFFGCVGRDALAPVALTLLERDGVDLAGVAAVDQPTGTALIAVDAKGENTIVVAMGANGAARATQVPDALLHPSATILLQLEIALPQVASLALRAGARGARVVLNAAPIAALDRPLLEAVDVLVVNRTEGEALAWQTGAATVEDLCRAYARTPRTLVVTLGAEGALYTAQGNVIARRAPVVDAIDAVGAGDAFTGALAAALDRGAPLDRAICEGLAAGALACTQRGAQAALPVHDAIRALADTL
ncbi:MAG TPA: ribokinase [Casimicrobiaceae bacterium]|nr:ribokinase [Casimicrobiaceae bacterium]